MEEHQLLSADHVSCPSLTAFQGWTKKLVSWRSAAAAYCIAMLRAKPPGDSLNDRYFRQDCAVRSRIAAAAAMHMHIDGHHHLRPEILIEVHTYLVSHHYEEKT